MPLASQMTRTGLSHGSRTNSSRLARQKKWLLLAVLSVAAIVVVFAVWHKLRQSPEQALANDIKPAPEPVKLPESSRAAAPPRVINFDRQTASGAGGVNPAGAKAAGPVNPAPRAPGDPLPAALPVAAAAGNHVPPASAAPAAPPLPPGSAAVAQGMKLLEENRLIEGRAALSRLLYEGRLAPAEAQAVRDKLAGINKTLVFSPQITPGDPLVETYVVQSGDRLSKVAPAYRLTDGAIGLINGIDPHRIRAGQKLKVVKGPFSAVVTKSDFRLDLYLAAPGAAAGSAESAPIYVQSFPVGLGKDDSTPVGAWIVRKGGKMVDPSWTNPRNPSEHFAGGDPKNPLGKYWIALDGVDANTQGKEGYGIHGTIEPASIGTQASMGCVRLKDGDIDTVYKLLVEGQSAVLIRP